MSGVGIYFGGDRIYDVLTGLDLFPKSTEQSTQILFTNLGDAEQLYCLPVITELRNKGIAVELYPDKAKLTKQFEYADKRAIPFVAVAGENEMPKKVITLKNMLDKTQQEVAIADIASYIVG